MFRRNRQCLSYFHTMMWLFWHFLFSFYFLPTFSTSCLPCGSLLSEQALNTQTG